MPLIESEKIFFVHIPKTGGSAIEIAMQAASPRLAFIGTAPNRDMAKLFNHSLQHCTVRELIDLGLNLDEYQVFTVVRHPYERVVSEYNYRLGCNDLFKDSAKSETMSLDEFLVAFLDKSQPALKRWDNHQLSSFEFLQDQSGNISPAIKVILYKNNNLLSQILNILTWTDPAARARFEAKLNTRFLGFSKKVTVDVLTPEQRELIYQAFKADFEHFLFQK